MININQATEEFTKYTHSFDMNNPLLKYKHEHSLSTMKRSKQIAISLRLSKEDVELAELIGLLHDIGRFYQLTKYNNWADVDTENHGSLAVQYLFEQGNIRKYISNNEDDHIIKVAVANHNLFQIEAGLSERELLHAKIIRDADKLDILYQLSMSNTNNFENKCHKHEYIRKNIYNEVLKGNPLRFAQGMNNVERSICIYGYISDIYFPYTRQEILDNNYYQQVLAIDKEYLNNKTYEQVLVLAKNANERLKKLVEEDKNVRKLG